MQTQAEARGLEIVRGSKGAWKVPIRDRAGRLVTTYTGSATLLCECWRGDDQAVLFSPAAAWIDPAVGAVRIDVTAAQSAAPTPGTYNLVLGITTTGDPVKRPIGGGLRVLPGPGVATARPAYTTFDDLKRYAGKWLDALLRLDVDQAGFAEERADAREALDELIQEYYRGGNYAWSYGVGYTPIVNAGQSDAWLQEQLDADRLIVSRKVREWCSRFALAIICGRQVDFGKENGFHRAASHFALTADDLATTMSPELDLDGDGRADLTVHFGTINRIRG